MNIVKFILVLLILLIQYNMQAQSMDNTVTDESITQNGYYGFFFDLDLNYYHYSSFNSNHNFRADFLLVYRKIFSDKYEVNFLANHYAIATEAYHNDSESILPVSQGSSNESCYDIILESVIHQNEKYNYYVAVEHRNGSLSYTDYYDFDIFNNIPIELTTTDIKAGITIEGVKGLHHNAPGNILRKGLFSELLAKAYLQFDNINKYAEESNFVMLANTSYSWLKMNNMMFTPAIYNSYDIEKKSLATITSLQFIWEKAANLRIDSRFSFGRYFKDGSKTIGKAKFDLKFNLFAHLFSTYFDFYVGWHVGHPTYKYNEEYFSDSSSLSFSLGMKILWGYK
jgi:hypothetical protein